MTISEMFIALKKAGKIDNNEEIEYWHHAEVRLAYELFEAEIREALWRQRCQIFVKHCAYYNNVEDYLEQIDENLQKLNSSKTTSYLWKNNTSYLRFT